MKKSLCVLGIGCLLCVLVIGCLSAGCSTEYKGKQSKIQYTLQYIESTNRYTIYVDITNGVQYFKMGHSCIPMVNPDGSLKIHPDFVQQAKESTKMQNDIQNNINIINNPKE